MPGYKKLGRPTAHRKAMLRNLVTDLLKYGHITTTLDRAKEAGRQAEKMITLAKRGLAEQEGSGITEVYARRQVNAYVYGEEVKEENKKGELIPKHKTKATKELFEKIAPHYETREGGYTRILKLGPRPGDNAEVVFLELIDWKDLNLEANKPE